VRKLLDQFNLGCVVTVEEDGRLPKHGTEPDPWERYRKGNVTWTEIDPREDVA
jgi:hypothetical protein